MQAAIVAVAHSEVPVQRPSSAGQLPAAEERTQLVANGGMKSRLWWLCAEGLARKPSRLPFSSSSAVSSGLECIRDLIRALCP